MNFLHIFTAVAVLLASFPVFGDVMGFTQYVQKRCGGRKNCVEPNAVLEATANASIKTGVSQPILLALASVESNFITAAANRENGVSAGLMQIQVSWHRQRFPARNYYDVDQNVLVGAQILRACANKHPLSDRRTLMCYNGYSNAHYPDKVLKEYQTIVSLREFKKSYQYQNQ